MAVQEGPTSIRLSWSPSSSPTSTGYIISYTGGSTGSVNVSGGTTDSYLLTGFRNGATYTISIATISQDLSSDTAAIEITLGMKEIQ